MIFFWKLLILWQKYLASYTQKWYENTITLFTLWRATSLEVERIPPQQEIEVFVPDKTLTISFFTLKPHWRGIHVLLLCCLTRSNISAKYLFENSSSKLIIMRIAQLFVPYWYNEEIINVICVVLKFDCRRYFAVAIC